MKNREDEEEYGYLIDDESLDEAPYLDAPSGDAWEGEEPPIEAMYAAFQKERAQRSSIAEIALADFFARQERTHLKKKGLPYGS